MAEGHKISVNLKKTKTEEKLRALVQNLSARFNVGSNAVCVKNMK